MTTPHPDDLAVDRFAQALKDKLAIARAKGCGGWQYDEPGMQQRLSDMLCEHVRKGDPRDVAAFCLFLHQRGEAILARGPMFPPVAVPEDPTGFDAAMVLDEANNWTTRLTGQQMLLNYAAFLGAAETKK